MGSDEDTVTSCTWWGGTWKEKEAEVEGVGATESD